MKSLWPIIAAGLIWGSVGVVTSQLTLPPLAIAFWRSLIGGVALLALIGAGRLTLRTAKSDVPLLAAAGAAVGLCWACLFYAFDFAGVGLGTLLVYCAPLFVVLLSKPVLGEQLSKCSLVGCAFILVGLIFIAGPGITAGPQIQKGIFLGLLGALLYAFTSLANKRRKSCGGLDATALQLLVASAAVACVALILHQPLTLHGGRELFFVVLLGTVHTGGGMALYFIALNRLRAQSVALWSYLEPVSALVWSATLLGERMTELQWIGGLLVLGAPVVLELLQGRSGCPKTTGGSMPRPPLCLFNKKHHS